MNPDPVNTTLLDRWSWGHLGVGVLGGMAGIRYPTYLLLHVVYDLGEQAVERTAWGQRMFTTYGPENLRNVVGDTLSASVGWWIGSLLRRL